MNVVWREADYTRAIDLTSVIINDDRLPMLKM